MTESSRLSSSTDRVFTSFIESSDPLGLFAASDCDALGGAIEDTLMPLTFPPLEALPCANLCQNPGRSGNLPAVDTINLKNNEKDKTRDFSLAFVASGDLRNVVRTVNALGADYTGCLHILLNDTSKTIVSRNIVLILILGAMPNEAVAADIALHFWYSVFLQEEHRLRILALLVLILQQHTDKTEPLSVDLGQCAKLTCLVPREITDRLLYTAGPTLSTLQARDEYERVYATPARRDARNRALAGVKPCHSLAFMAFWRSGVALPFSAVSDHHTAPNASLFSPCDTRLWDDVENPLASWDPNEIVKSGQAHGAQLEDIYGCLYFFLSDQLRTFAKRIRELDVTFHVFNTAAHTLAGDISGGQYSKYGLTPSIRFDRIDLAHTLADLRYMRDVLQSWTLLLAPGDTAAIVGVFSDWTNAQRDGSIAGADVEAVVAPIVGKLIKLGRLPPGTTLADAMATETAQLDAAYDNSKAFSRFLKTSSFSDVLRETTLKRRLRHKILPQVNVAYLRYQLGTYTQCTVIIQQRVRMPIDAKSSDLPHVPDDETWYRYVCLFYVFAVVPFY
ncbi:hypothetical protein J3R83DRAFT_4891 [Lanmaoa asiatica]|nr:hypothetical protein J3R83DRAFT_4891 [Lanmaoa asiatica]